MVPRSQPPNILWITCDEMRWDALPPCGNSFTDMPAATRLATEGTLFPNTFCQMPKCVPSRCSMLTGRYPHVDGFRTLRGKRPLDHATQSLHNDFFTLSDGTPNIIPLVKDCGYRTCLLGKNHVVDWNLHQVWFDQTPSWDFERVPKTETDPLLLRAKYQGPVPENYSLDRHPDAVTAREAAEFIGASDSRPFFALVDMSLPHPCYHTFGTMPVAQRPLEEIPLPPSAPLGQMPFLEQALRRSKDLESLSDEHRRLIRRAYWSMCEFADRQVAKILDALDASGKADNTLVIYTADHGDFAGDHNCYEKWDTSFLDSIVRVPLLMRFPGRMAPGAQCQSLVELLDLFPTILETMGQPVPSYAQGRSLWAPLRGEVSGWRDEVICQGGVESTALRLAVPADRDGVDPGKQEVLLNCPESMAKARMVRTNRWKYIHRLIGGHELYDLQADPQEMHNVISDTRCRGVLEDLRNRLISRLMEAETRLPEISALYA